MRFTTILALTSMVAGVFSAPIEADMALDKRAADPSPVIDTLNSAIAGPISSINSILSGVSSSSSTTDKNAAIASITPQISSIVSAVDTATTSVKALSKRDEDFVKRQDALQTALTTLLSEVNTLAESLVADLGLTSALGLLNPLVGSLSGLLLSLEAVVDNLLAVVETIVNDLLTGLSIGLAGLTL